MSSGPSQTIALPIGTILSFIFCNCIDDDRYLTMINQPGYVWITSGEKAGDVSGKNADVTITNVPGLMLKIMEPLNGCDLKKLT